MISVSAREVEQFKSKWPCSGIPSKAVSFTFDKRNGDLVDCSSRADGPAMVALSQDAWNGRKQ